MSNYTPLVYVDILIYLCANPDASLANLSCYKRPYMIHKRHAVTHTCGIGLYYISSKCDQICTFIADMLYEEYCNIGSQYVEIYSTGDLIQFNRIIIIKRWSICLDPNLRRFLIIVPNVSPWNLSRTQLIRNWPVRAVLKAHLYIRISWDVAFTTGL